MLSLRKTYDTWIKYYPFSWGLKNNNGDGIKNDTEYYITNYTDLIFNDIMVLSENLSQIEVKKKRRKYLKPSSWY